MALSASSSQLQQPSQRLPKLDDRFSGAQESLRTFLLGAIERWSQGLGLVHQLGVLPHTSIQNKFPYSKEALAHPERAARPSFTQTRAARLHAACAACPPDVSAIRPRPKRARDAFGPGMVLVVNTVLAWLMFSIDVRNSMLR
ncbi:hypothetical protein ABPG77_010808 [Micractinium sp. CCAP 211/92]